MISLFHWGEFAAAKTSPDLVMCIDCFLCSLWSCATAYLKTADPKSAVLNKYTCTTLGLTLTGSYFFHELQALIIILMTLVEGAYGRNGDTVDANLAEGGERTRDRATSLSHGKLARKKLNGNRKSLRLSVLK